MMRKYHFDRNGQTGRSGDIIGFKDVMLGSRPDMVLLPGMQQSISDVGGMNFRMPKYIKQLNKGLTRGEDISNMGAFAPLRQAEAADLADIDESYMFGANALAGAQGGEQLNQLNAMRDRAKMQRRGQTGNQYVNALSGVRDEIGRAYQNREAGRMWQQEMLGKLRGNVYDRSRQGGGLLGSLVQGAAGVASAYATGGMAAGAKPSCWVARALWGDTDPRVFIVRCWLMLRSHESLFWLLFWKAYGRFGQRVANKVRKGKLTHWVASLIFNRILQAAE